MKRLNCPSWFLYYLKDGHARYLSQDLSQYWDIEVSELRNLLNVKGDLEEGLRSDHATLPAESISKMLKAQKGRLRKLY